MTKLFELLGTEAKHLRQAGLLKAEPCLASPQGPRVTLQDKEFLNFASNDYLGLANHPEVKIASISAIEAWGSGVASARMATGTIPLHGDLERALARFTGTEDALLFPSGYHANTGIFESLLSDRDFVFADEQVRPSLADGIRLSRARAYSYRNLDMEHLEDRLRRSRAARFRVIVSDGVFPLSGLTSHLREMYGLAAKYDALVAVDDSHGIGVLGEHGRGTHRHHGIGEKIDLLTGTFGNALGGGAGGFVAGRTEIIAWLRQKSRPYLSSTGLSPGAVGAALKAFDLLANDPKLLETLRANNRILRAKLHALGLLQAATGEHPAIAVHVRDAVLAQRLTDLLYRRGIYALGFCHPIVPEGAARVRVQVTARHTQADLEHTADAFASSIRELG
jgi:glycine C-acetyltransferase